MTLRPRIVGVWWIAALLPVLLASSTGCGRKGPPAVPRVVAPALVEDVRAEPRGTGVLLSWTRPTRNQDGSPLSDLLEFRIVRAVGVVRGPGLPAAAFLPLATVRADRPENASVQGSLYAYLDDPAGQGLAVGRQYRYRIQAINRDGAAGPPSGEAVVDLLTAPPPPGSLTGTPGDGTARLEWSAPPPVPGSEAPAVRGYNIYRGLRPGVHGPQPVNAAPQSDTQFLDTGLQNETTYYYVVRSVSGDGPPWRESLDSSEVSVALRDLVPPAPPRGLVAVPGADGVALTWQSSAEADLLGYLVYRREPPHLAPVRLTDAPIGRTTFTDTGARPGVAYLYTVTAVDRSVHRNESAPSAEAEASRP
jgi:hypothetical protein